MPRLKETVNIDLGISIESRHTALISGTVSDPAITQGVEILGSDGSDLGPANLNPDGTWTFDAFYDPTLAVQAVSTDTSGNQEKSETLLIASGSARPGQTTSAIGEQGSEIFNVYNSHGRALYTGTITAPDNTDVLEITGLGGPGIPYNAPSPGTGQEYIENFRVAGQHHDTLNLADSGLASLAQVIHHTTMNGGSATIHIDSQTSVTLLDVTKHQLATHKQDFVFG